MHFTQTFKKYKAEYRADVVKAAMAAAPGLKLAIYEDNSIVKLTGTVTDVEFTSSTFSGTVSGTGVIDAVYEVEAGRPALVQGVLTPPASFAATCTWMAHLE